MSDILGVPVDAAYYVVTTLAGGLTPLAGGLAVAVAIILFTIAVRVLLLPLSYRALRGQVAQSRLAPQVQVLRQRHRHDPERLTREIQALYRANGASMSGGFLPLLLQWPFLSVMYLLFRSGTIHGAPNTLLRHHLFGSELGAHWLSGAGPLSLQGAVWAGVFALLMLAGYLSARVSRRLFPPASPVTTPSWLTGVLPLLTAVLAAFLPLAGALYLLTTATWTLLERRVLARFVPTAPSASRPAGPSAAKRVSRPAAKRVSRPAAP